MSGDTLENKFHLMTMLPFDKRIRRKHSAVYGFILDWYHRKYGNALASVRHIASTLKDRDPDGIGFFVGDIHSALKDLVAWGYLTQELGKGRRASRYIPVWDFRSVHKSPNATELDVVFGETQNTSVRETPNTTDDSVRKTPNKDPSTRTRLKDGVTGIDGHDCAPASPPPLAAPVGGAKAGCAQDAFDELWKAYGYRQKRADAKTAYAKLAPDADLHSRLVEAATAWRTSWAAQGDSKAPRFTLAKWLDREEYECDPPARYAPKGERKAKPAKAAEKRPANDNAPSYTLMVNDVSPFTMPGTYKAQIVDAKVDERDGVGKITLCLKWSGGKLHDAEHMFYFAHPSKDIQDRGQAFLERLKDVFDISDLYDTDQFLDRCATIKIDDYREIKYLQAA